MREVGYVVTYQKGTHLKSYRQYNIYTDLNTSCSGSENILSQALKLTMIFMIIQGYSIQSH